MRCKLFNPITNSLIAFAIFMTPFMLTHASYGQDRPSNPEIVAPISKSENHHHSQKPQPHNASASAFPNAIAVTANPYASRAGAYILKQGGSAIDAAIAAQLVLGLTEPQSSGLGGGAFMVYYDATHDRIQSFDARETAPASATPDLFVQKDASGAPKIAPKTGNKIPMAFWDAVIGGQSIGVPGTPKLLYDMHQKFGTLPWADLFQPALDLAENGFPVSPRLAGTIQTYRDRLAKFPQSRDYFLDDHGHAKPVGTILKNPAYAKTLRQYQAGGADVFYHGAIAKNLINEIPGQPFTADDLSSYQVKQRDAVCDTYRGYKICSMGQPSSGGLTLLQILKLIEPFDMGTSINVEAIHLIGQASRLAFADRNYYMADPDFVSSPGIYLLDDDYLAQRRALISKTGQNILHSENISPGIPQKWLDDLARNKHNENAKRSADNIIKPPGTTHLSMIDNAGNMVSMTSTIEQAFGSHVMIDGFMMNNELTDFSFLPAKDGNIIANRVEPGKRPRSSMTPTLIFHPDGRPYMIIGSAGGSRIIGYVLKSIIHVIDWGAQIDDAITAPHFLSRGGAIEMEAALAHMKPALESLGHEVKIDVMNSGLTGILINPNRGQGTQSLTPKHNAYFGAADPRREGIAAGH